MDTSLAQATHQRRIGAFNRLMADPDFVEFIQDGMFGGMVNECNIALRDSDVVGPALEKVRDKLVLAEELRDFIPNELRLAEQAAAQAAQEPPQPPGQGANYDQ